MLLSLNTLFGSFHWHRANSVSLACKASSNTRELHKHLRWLVAGVVIEHEKESASLTNAQVNSVILTPSTLQHGQDVTTSMDSSSVVRGQLTSAAISYVSVVPSHATFRSKIEMSMWPYQCATGSVIVAPRTFAAWKERHDVDGQF